MKYSYLAIVCFLVSFSSIAQKYTGDQVEIDAILRQADAWSEHYMNSDTRKLANLYTQDGKIMPTNAPIISGRDAIAERFQLPEGVTAIDHRVSPEEISVMGDTAFDYGYYEGITKNESGEESAFKGKYVIIWKKVEDTWYIYLDIWNSIPQAD